MNFQSKPFITLAANHFYQSVDNQKHFNLAEFQQNILAPAILFALSNRFVYLLC